MSDGAIVVLGFLALISVVAITGLFYDRLYRLPATPCHWSDAEDQHTLIMSRYYANFGPPE